MGKVVHLINETQCDYSTGEVLSESTTETLRFPSEPPYVKMYLDDISTILNIPESDKKLLILMLKKLDYDGYITLSKRYRDLMASQLGIKDQVLRNKISRLKKTGIIKSAGYGEYMVNPNYFAKGKWKEVVEQRKRFSMIVTYDSKGGREIKTDIVEDVEEQTDMFQQ